MKKVILLDNEKFNWAMADLIELKDVMETEYISKGQTWTSAEDIHKAVAQILNAFEEAASIAELAEDGEQFEIMNAEEGTFMDISEELES